MNPIAAKEENRMTEDQENTTASRREFLRCAGEKVSSFALMAAAGGGVVKAVCGQAPSGESDYDPTKHSYAYVVDIDKCIGCGSCVRACERENDVPKDYFRTWVERFTVSRTGEVEVDSPDGAHNGFPPKVTGKDVTRAFFAPKLCNHCTDTPCVQLCPVGASYRTDDGLILVDDKRCIGCGYCVQACPYGSRFIHPKTHVASKCTWCYHRITQGLKPACVEVCPTDARLFGDLEEPGDEVAEIIATQPVRVLKPELKTVPNCYYKGLGMEVV
ncbi:MAG: 4Fe-4S dicluster domain-containing protein [Planctomycetota bacterium]|jgi:Fe-S-cluster-containing dehydrogenase component